MSEAVSITEVAAAICRAANAAWSDPADHCLLPAGSCPECLAAAQAAAGLRRGKGGWAKWREKYPLANRSNASQQRAIRRKVCVQKVDLLAIFERDGWRCYICGVTCDPAAKRCTTLAAEADHVIPISRGGAHSEDNIRCACFQCNRAKAARSEPPKYYVAEIDKKTLK